MFRKTLLLLLLLLAGLMVAAFVTAPAPLAFNFPQTRIQGDLDTWLEQTEAEVNRVAAIKPGAEKRIVWNNPVDRVKTPWSVVYLHGFSASRKETAPLSEQLADRLDANLFETRLKGHGLQFKPLAEVKAEDWLSDASEALAIGGAIGEKILLIGTSTGATLALAMANQQEFTKVGALVLLSPNLGLPDPKSEWLTQPGGLQLAYLMIGKARSWTTTNPLQEQFWSTSYPTDALVEVMRLVQFARGILPLELTQPLLMIFSAEDSVVDISQMHSAFEQIASPRKAKIEIVESDDPSNHVLVGDIMSPDNTAPLVKQVMEFLAE